MALRWALTVLVPLVLCAALGHSLPHEVTGRETDPQEALGSSLNASRGEESSRDANMTKDTLEETANTVNNALEAVPSHEGLDFGTLQKIMKGIMYIIDSYFDSASLGEWLATLGMAAREESQEEARDWKFSPPVVELVEALRPLGFAPYPDPYIPMAMSKKDIITVTINWLALFGIIGLFCKYSTGVTDLDCSVFPGLTVL